MTYSCGGSCAQACGLGGGGSDGGQTVASQAALDLAKHVADTIDANHKAMIAAFAADTDARDAAVASDHWTAPAECTTAVKNIFAGAEEFEKEADKLGLDTLRDQVKSALKKGSKKPKSAKDYRQAYDEMRDWVKSVEEWTKETNLLKECQERHCSNDEMLKLAGEGLRRWLASFKGDAAESAARVDKAANALQSYVLKVQAASQQNMVVAAACVETRK